MQSVLKRSIKEIRGSLQAHFEIEYLLHGLGRERLYRVGPHDDEHCFILEALEHRTPPSGTKGSVSFHRIPADKKTHPLHELTQEQHRLEQKLNAMAAQRHPFPLVTAGPAISHFIVTPHVIPLDGEAAGRMKWKVRVMHEL